jgi:peptidoglycan/LPS O-acetylase OafA/YrhL
MNIPQLTFTRFLAAIAIVFFHYAQALEPFSSELHFVARWSTGVSFFFILSGFLMVISNADKEKIDYKIFLNHRFVRIYPVYLLSMVMILSYHLLRPGGFDIDWTGVLLNAFMVQAWLPDYAMSFNFVAWSISVEMVFYFTFPLLFNYVYKRFSLSQTTVAVLLFWLLSQIIIYTLRNSSFYDGTLTASNMFIRYHPLTHLSSFFVGNLAALYWVKFQKDKKANYSAYVLLLGFLYLIVIYFYSGSLVLNNGLLALIFVPFIYLLSADNSKLSVMLSHKAFVFLGEISYGIYILQFAVFLWLASVCKKAHIVDGYSVYYISFVALLIVSALAYQYVERPSRKLRMKK